ncbi:MAG: hypothetical protein AAF798_12775, partial [Bacteroidota bacterium]
MAEKAKAPVSIQGPQETLGPALNYETLRKLGLAAIIQTGSAQWTDYNEHDPGITILETIIYALTDLGYRSDFPIEDILAQQQLSEEELARTQFYTARHILTNNPLTIADYRKVIIDVKGVQNAWVEPVVNAFEPTRGALEIIADATENIVTKAQREALKVQIEKQFYAHRNLSHDLAKVTLRPRMEVFFQIELVVESQAVVELVVAKVYLALNQYLRNAVQFLSLEEALAFFEQDVNAVFNGPKLEHGFLPDSALNPALAELRSVDLIPILEDIQEVLKIEELKFHFSDEDLGTLKYLLKEPAWTYQRVIPIRCKPVLAPLEQQHINIKKSDSLYRWDLTRAKIEYKNLASQQRVSKLSPQERDLPIPKGNFRELETYYSIQEDFPKVYGLPPHGPPPFADTKRKMQIKQLRSFLLIFDQILANYLSQLAHVGQLFSWSSEVKRTYFFQGLERAIADLVGLLDDDQPKENGADLLDRYRAQLAQFRESPSTFLERRNRFLTHLLARFGRKLHIYTQDLPADGPISEAALAAQQQIELETKQRVLENYTVLSTNRAKGFNLLQQPANLPEEFSGLRQWTETLFDMEPESLEVFHFNDRFFIGDYDFDDPDKNLVSEFVFYTKDGSPVDMEELARIGTDPGNYELESNKTKLGVELEYKLSLFKTIDINQPAKIYHLDQRFQTAEATLKAIDRLVALFKRYNRTSERIYLVEHFLLRPYAAEPYFGLTIQKADGQAWLRTSEWYPQTQLEQLGEMVQEDYLYFALHNPFELETGSGGTGPSFLETWGQTGELRPIFFEDYYETGPTGSGTGTGIDTGTGETAKRPLPKAVFSISSATSGSYDLQLSYGAVDQPVKLKALKSYDSDVSIVRDVHQWVKDVARYVFFVQPNEMAQKPDAPATAPS